MEEELFLLLAMGTDIETWEGNFTSATIESVYIDTFFAQTCFVVKRDSDSDTNDDYLDKYEWGEKPWAGEQEVYKIQAQGVEEDFIPVASISSVGLKRSKSTS